MFRHQILGGPLDCTSSTISFEFQSSDVSRALALVEKVAQWDIMI